MRDRLDVIHEFRAGHEKLREVVVKVLRDEDASAVATVEQAPRQVTQQLPTSLLDLSQQGSMALRIRDIRASLPDC